MTNNVYGAPAGLFNASLQRLQWAAGEPVRAACTCTVRIVMQASANNYTTLSGCPTELKVTSIPNSEGSWPMCEFGEPMFRTIA